MMESFPSTVLTVLTRCFMYFSLRPTKPNSFSTCRHTCLVSTLIWLVRESRPIVQSALIEIAAEMKPSPGHC